MKKIDKKSKQGGGNKDESAGDLELQTSYGVSDNSGQEQELIITQEGQESEQDRRNRRLNSYSQGYSFVMRVLWFHFYSILKKLKKVEKENGKKIEIENLPELEDDIKVEQTLKQLKGQIEALNRQQTVSHFQFLFMIAKTFKHYVVGIMSYISLEVTIKLFSPFITAKLINCVKDGDVFSSYLWLGILLMLNFLGITFGQHSWTKAQRLSAKLRLGLINILYDKVTNLSVYSAKQANVGKIINMISSDFSSFENNGVYIFHSLLAPLSLSISSGILIWQMGYIAFIAIFLLLLLFPLQKKITERASVYTKLQAQERDQKMKLFSEMMIGMRTVKMYGWEQAFNTIINGFRNKELKNILQNQVIVYIEQTLSLQGPLCVALICFLLIDLTSSNSGGPQLNAPFIFSTIEMLNTISISIMSNVGYGLNFLFDFKILVQRYMSIISIKNEQMKSIDDFTQSTIEREQSTKSSSQIKQNRTNNIMVEMKDFSAYWSTNNQEMSSPVLSNINLKIKKGEKISVIGQIGSGKTSLLFAIMKEIPRYKGQFKTTSSLSYVEQDPFILQGTVRDNILFGKSFDKSFYNTVVKGCCLIEDFNSFPQADLTLIGQRGTSLSGGQKMRICLARAIYADTDLYLLDDPLSSVDSKVANKLFFNIINGLLKDKTVILVTHLLTYALQFQRIAVFDKGSLVLQGDPKEIDFSSNVLAKYIEQCQNNEAISINSQTDSNQNQSSDENLEDEQDGEDEDYQDEQINTETINANKNQYLIEEPEQQIIDRKEKKKQTKKVESTILKENKKEEDQFVVSLKSYINYIKINPKPYFILIVLFVYCMREALFTTFYKVLSLYDNELQKEYFYCLIFFTFASLFFFSLFSSSIMSYFLLQSSQALSRQMTISLSQAKPVVFDEIPSGSIINKYQNDINILDKQLPESAFNTLEGVLHFINLIASIIYINKIFLIPAIIEIYFFQKWFIYVKPILLRGKQLDLENKAPIFTFFQNSLSGHLTIKLNGQQKAFQKRMEELMNNSIRTADIFWFISRLFSVYMQYAASLTSGVGIFLLLTYSDLDYSSFGQSLSFFLLLNSIMHLTLRCFINVDTFMTSSERAHSIINLPKESINAEDVQPIEIEEAENNRQQVLKSLQSSKNNWDAIASTESDRVAIDVEKLQENNENVIASDKFEKEGSLVFDNVYMKYKEGLDHVLKGVSFEVQPLQRIAIVGRTGAGKSSIIQSLFRMSEIDSFSPDGIESKILLNGQDTKQMHLHKLRRSINIIPQNPFLFSCSVRRNLDPLDEYTDTKLINVLKETGLYEKVSNLPEGIQTDVSGETEIFSMGQKQLICLARVMLKKNSIMVLDEATANVDMETDQKIQEVLKEKLKETTIITIAHRLNTIADYDLVIAMDSGKVVEVGHPYILLTNNSSEVTTTNNSSLFSKMVAHTGPVNAQHIFQISKEAYLSQQKDF